MSRRTNEQNEQSLEQAMSFNGSSGLLRILMIILIMIVGFGSALSSVSQYTLEQLFYGGLFITLFIGLVLAYRQVAGVTE